ncbi:unnamed protein product [Caenorhabditis brenneri]
MLFTAGVPATTPETTPSPPTSSCIKGVIGYSDSANGTCLFDGAMKSDPFDKTAYYECCQRTWYLKYCVEGFSFDGTSDKIPTNFLPSTSSQICFPGDKEKNQFDGSKFDECVDGTHWETMECSLGLRFNSITKQCQIVPTTAACVHGEKREMPNGDPSKYLFCNGNEWEVRECSTEFLYDQYQKKCVEKHTTRTPDHSISTKLHLLPTTSSQICLSGDKQKNQLDDSKFDECIDGTHWETKTCSSGFRFNSITKQCQIVPTTAACVHGEKREMPNGDSSKYLFCDGNEWEVRECSTEFLYDKYQKKCVEKHTTRTPNHSTSTQRPSESCRESMGQDGYKPNPADCRTFYQCVHGKWMKRDCGPGTQWFQSIIGCDHYTGC